MRIDERIARQREELSPQEGRAADTLLEHLDDLATYRAAELASMAGVSKATMSRLFHSLGFADFGEVRDHLRALRVSGEPRRTDGPPNLALHAASDADAIETALGQPALGEAIALLSGAEQVLVAGWRNSYPVAAHLREQLVHARPRVSLAPVPGQMIGQDLADLGPGDAVVAVGFRRRPRGFGAFLLAAATTGASVVLLADSTAAGLSARAGLWLEVGVQGTLAYDSYATAMSVVSVLADGVLHARGAHGPARVASISDTYELLDEVE